MLVLEVSISWITLLIVYALWPLYVFTMAMLAAYRKKSVTLFAWILALPLVVIAIVIDVVLNYSIFALVTMDFPKRGEWTFSKRLNRLVKEKGLRGRFARWLAKSLLDPYDPDGKHIKEDASW